MSDTMDDVRAHVAEMRHERGECGPNCSFCEHDTCGCGQPVVYDILCKACLWDGLYSNACMEVRDELGLEHGEWLTSQQMVTAELRAEKELDRLMEEEASRLSRG